MKTRPWANEIGVIDTFRTETGHDFLYNDDGSISYAIEISCFDDIAMLEDQKEAFVNNFIMLILKQIEDYDELSVFQYPERLKDFANNFIRNCKSKNETVKTLNKAYLESFVVDYYSFQVSTLRTILIFKFNPLRGIIPEKAKKNVYSKIKWEDIERVSSEKASAKFAALQKLNLSPRHLSWSEVNKVILYTLNPHIYMLNLDLNANYDFNYRFFSNPSIEQTEMESSKVLNEQFAYSTLSPDLNMPTFEMQNQDPIYFNTIHFLQYPSVVYYDTMKIFSSLPLPFFFFTNIKYVDQKTYLAGLKRRLRVSSTHLEQSKDDSEAEGDSYQEKRMLRKELEKEAQKAVNVDQSLVLFNHDKNILLKSSSTIVNELRSLGIQTDNSEGRHEEFYLNSFPFKSNYSDSHVRRFLKAFVNLPPKSKRQYSLTTTSKVASVLVSFTDSNKGHTDPYVVFKDARTLRPVGLQPFDTSFLSAPNGTITGGTGSGKSFIAGSILLKLQNLKSPVTTLSLDKGSSHQRFNKVVGGVSLKINPADPSTTFNIFDTYNKKIMDPKEKDIEGKLNDIANYFLALQNPRDPNFNCQPSERNVLIESIRECYAWWTDKTGKALDIDDPDSFPTVKDYVKMASNKNSNYKSNQFIQHIVKNLESYETSSYNNLINCRSPKFKYRNMVSFDLELIYNDQDIIIPEVLKISSYIKNIVNTVRLKDSTSRWILFVDELWLFLTKGQHFSFIMDMLDSFIREARKKGGMVLNASQNLADFENGKSLLNNSPLKLIGKAHSIAEYNLICEAMQFNESLKAHFSDCGVKHGSYSKFILQAGNYFGPVLIEPTPIEYALFTTDPNDCDHQYAYFKKRGLDPNDMNSLIQYSNEFPKGSFSINKEIV